MQCSSLTSCSTFTPNYWAPNKCANCYKPESAHTGDGANGSRRTGRDRSTLGRRGALDKKRPQVSPQLNSELSFSTSALPTQPGSLGNGDLLNEEQNNDHEGNVHDETNEAGLNLEEEQIVGSGKKKLERKGSLSRMKHMVEKMVFKRKDSSVNNEKNPLASPLSSSSSSLPFGMPNPVHHSSSPTPAPRSTSGSKATADDLPQNQHRLQLYKLRVLIEAELASQFPQRSPKEIELVLVELDPHLVNALARLMVGGILPPSDYTASAYRAPPSAPVSLKTSSTSPSAQISLFSAASLADGLTSGSPLSARSITSTNSLVSASDPPSVGHRRTFSTSSSSSTFSTSPSYHQSPSVAPRSITSVALNTKDRARVVYEYDQPHPDPASSALKDKVIVIHSMANPERWWHEHAGNDEDGSMSPSVSVKLLEGNSSDDVGSPQMRRVAHAESRSAYIESEQELSSSSSEDERYIHDRRRNSSGKRKTSNARQEAGDGDEEDLPEWSQVKKESKTRSGEQHIGSPRSKNSDQKDRLVSDRAVKTSSPTPIRSAGSRGGSLIKVNELSTINTVEHAVVDSSDEGVRVKKKNKRKDGTKKKSKKMRKEGDDAARSDKSSQEEEDLAPGGGATGGQNSKRPGLVRRSASTGMEKQRKKQTVSTKTIKRDKELNGAPRPDNRTKKERKKKSERGRNRAEEVDEKRSSDAEEDRRLGGKKHGKSRSEIRHSENENRTTRSATLF